MDSFRQNDDVGATLVVAPVAGCIQWGDHKGRPYRWRCDRLAEIAREFAACSAIGEREANNVSPE